jgi:hypothetical protein
MAGKSKGINAPVAISLVLTERDVIDCRDS